MGFCVFSSSPNLSVGNGGSIARVFRSGSDRGQVVPWIAAFAYVAFALIWSASGRSDLEHAKAAALAAATGAALAFAFAILAVSSVWSLSSHRTGRLFLAGSCAALSATSIAASYVVHSEHSIIWRPVALSWMEAAALLLLLFSLIAWGPPFRLDVRRITTSLDALVIGLGVGTAAMVVAHGAIDEGPARWSVAATLIGIAAGTATVIVAVQAFTFGKNAARTSASVSAVAAVWTATLLTQDLGRAADSPGWLSLGRWLLPLATIGVLTATNQSRHEWSQLAPFSPSHNRLVSPHAAYPLVWATPVAIAATAAGAWYLDSSMAWDLGLGCALSLAILIGRQALVLEGERQRVRDLLELSAELERVAKIDQVTGIPNRTALDERLAQEMERAMRYRQPVSICCIDIDHFKNVNDRFGHATGDLALRSIAVSLQRTGRSIDFVARAGGEEFVVIAPGTWSADALILGERLRAQVERLRIAGRDGREMELTISVGIAGYPEHGTDGATIMERADEALYVSKEMGRNRVTLWQSATDD